MGENPRKKGGFGKRRVQTHCHPSLEPSTSSSLNCHAMSDSPPVGIRAMPVLFQKSTISSGSILVL